MKRLLPVLFLLTAAQSLAQPEGRVFTIFTQPYTSLGSPTVITTPGWDDPAGIIPLGFNFSMLGKTSDSLFLDNVSPFGTGTTLVTDMLPSVANGFGFFADIQDRNIISSLPPSTIGYQTDVVNGKKVAKIEWNNVGFYYEYDLYGTMDDYSNFQLWLYEDNNDLEVHWGPNSIMSDYEDIFDFGSPFFGIASNLDLINQSFDWIYYVKSTSPAVADSIDLAGLMTLSPPFGFSPYPASGTVFRFAKPVAQGVNGVALNDYATVYPTAVTGNCFVELSRQLDGTISLIDMNGRVVLYQKAAQGKNTLDMGHLASGSYVINIRSANESVFYKIVKQ